MKNKIINYTCISNKQNANELCRRPNDKLRVNNKEKEIISFFNNKIDIKGKSIIDLIYFTRLPSGEVLTISFYKMEKFFLLCLYVTIVTGKNIDLFSKYWIKYILEITGKTEIYVLIHNNFKVAGSKLEMPSYAKSGTTIKIECELDHETHDIEHVKWYKDNQPFYTVVPANTKPATKFELPGVPFNVSNPNRFCST